MWSSLNLFSERIMNLYVFNSCFWLIIFSCYSGEKTSAKEWSTSLEIKGRVRLDAFEKFLQELPLSRSRAVMVSHVSFYCITVSYYSNSRKRKISRITLLMLPLIGLLVLTQFRIFSHTNDICFRLTRPCVNFGYELKGRIFLWMNDVFTLICHVCSGAPVHSGQNTLPGRSNKCI